MTGDRIRLIDHELAFPRTLIGDRESPWQLGGLQWLKDPRRHIFYDSLSKHASILEFRSIRRAWTALSDSRLGEIRAAIPQEWGEALPAVDQALGQVRKARDNMNGVISEVKRVLT